MVYAIWKSYLIAHQAFNIIRMQGHTTPLLLQGSSLKAIWIIIKTPKINFIAFESCIGLCVQSQFQSIKINKKHKDWCLERHMSCPPYRKQRQIGVVPLSILKMLETAINHSTQDSHRGTVIYINQHNITFLSILCPARHFSRPPVIAAHWNSIKSIRFALKCKLIKQSAFQAGLKKALLNNRIETKAILALVTSSG